MVGNNGTRTIVSPPVGQSLTFLATAAETGGEMLRLEARLRPGAFVPPHRHLAQEERFEVLAGRGTFHVGARRVRAEPGDRVVIAARRSHAFRNGGDEELRVIAELRPALDAQSVFEALFALGAAGRVNRLGAPAPSVTAELMLRHPDAFFYLPGLPVRLQRALARRLAGRA
jgi:quercetin dioxygenase-like cupin family protein